MARPRGPRGSQATRRRGGRPVARDVLERVDHVDATHLAQPVQQLARVLEHHAGLLALLDQLRDELTHSLVAPGEGLRVVVVADVRVLHHVLEVADQCCGRQVGPAGWNQRLVHVQSHGHTATDVGEVDITLVKKNSPTRPPLRQALLLSADVRQPIDVLGDLT